MPKQIDYKRTCFVIMPFGKKPVDGKEIDFDQIYHQIFKPAISAVQLPDEEGGGNLIPKRTDQDYFAASIDTEMYFYLEYSRFAFVDITSLNPNVFYELGVRHHAHQSGTAIFRQVTKQTPPFDINHIKAFPYEYEPEDQIEASKKLITDVLTASLEYNRMDSPVQIALAAQQKLGAQSGEASTVDKFLIEATNALRNGDFITAIEKYKKAIQQGHENPVLYQEMGLLLKKQENWQAAADAFEKATKLSPDYPDAWRELGIAQNKLYNMAKQDPALPTGEIALQKSIKLNPEDFDSYASLGGIYKREKLFEKAAEAYGRSVEVSKGHPYPLLNAIILQVRTNGIMSVSPKQKLHLKRAELPLRKQITDNPPYNAPWSFFDLSTIDLLNGKPEDALNILEQGAVHAEGWQLKTHFETLELIKDQQGDITGLKSILDYLKELVD